MRVWLRFVALGSILSAGSAVAQDLTVTSRVTNRTGESRTAVSYISRDRVRMAEAGDREAIIDLPHARVTTIDTKNRTYAVMTRRDMDELAARVKARMDSPEMKKARESLKNLPPEQRKKIDETLGGGDFDVRKTGGGRTIAGHRCENWTIAIGTLSRTDECLAEDIPIPPQIWEMYRGFAESLRTMMASFGPSMRDISKIQEKFKDMKGFPLATTTTVTIMGNTTHTSSEVTDIRSGPIPASAWEMPAGYREVENPVLKALNRKPSPR
jgi:hypothetical protein